MRGSSFISFVDQRDEMVVGQQLIVGGHNADHVCFNQPNVSLRTRVGAIREYSEFCRTATREPTDKRRAWVGSVIPSGRGQLRRRLRASRSGRASVPNDANDHEERNRKIDAHDSADLPTYHHCK